MSKTICKVFKTKRLFNRLVVNKISSKSFAKHLSQSTENNEQNSNHFDVVINGGGIVGFSTLLALKNSPFLRDKKVCLIEKELKQNAIEFRRSDNQFSNRVSSITTSSKQFFERINIWNYLEEFAKPVKEFYVWSQRYKNGINFRYNYDRNNDVICYVIENNRILSSLQSKVENIENIFYETIVTNVTNGDNCLQIETKCLNSDSTNSLKTSLLIGCDGFNSIVRQKSNLDNFEHDLEQFGIVGTIAVSGGEANQLNEIAFQRFVSFNDSVIGLLPLTEDFSSFVWSVSKQLKNDLMEMSEQQFVDHLNDSLFTEAIPSSTSFVAKLDEMIGTLTPKQFIDVRTPPYLFPHIMSLVPNSRQAFPLKFSTTLPFIVGSPNQSKDNNRIVLIGDAAHRVHPLAGQGLNLGIGDADILSQCLHNRLSIGETLFGENVYDFKQLENCLFDFESQRQVKLIPMMAAIHSMQQLFSCVPSNLLTVFNSSDFLKQRIVSFANSA